LLKLFLVEYRITAWQLRAFSSYFCLMVKTFVISEVRVWKFVRRVYKHTSTLCIKYSVSVKSYEHDEGTTLVKFYLAVTYINILTTYIKDLLDYYYYYYYLLLLLSLLLLFRYTGLENCEIN